MCQLSLNWVWTVLEAACAFVKVLGGEVLCSAWERFCGG